MAGANGVDRCRMVNLSTACISGVAGNLVGVGDCIGESGVYWIAVFVVF